MAYHNRRKPAGEARTGWEVLDPFTGIWGRVESVAKMDGTVKLKIGKIPAGLGITVPIDQVLTFRSKRSAKRA